MPHIKLTEKAIEGLRHEGSSNQTIYRDLGTKGLAIRVTDKGVKSYIVEGELHHRTVRITIGNCDDWPLENKWENIRDEDGRSKRVLVKQGARERATELRAKLDRDIDPREEAQAQATARKESKEAVKRAKQASEEAQKYTLAALCTEYVDYLEKRDKHKSALATKSLTNVHIVKAFPKFAALPANAVTSRQVAEIIRKVREAGKERTAGILRNYLLAAYNAAIRAPFDSAMPSTMIAYNITANPALVVPAIPVRAGNHVLTDDELQTYINALGDSLEDKALMIALYAGGQRASQLVRATVADWDSDTQTLRLEDDKGRRRNPYIHFLPLAPKAAAMVADLVKAAKKAKRPELFLNKSGTGTLDPNELSYRLAEIRKVIGGEPFDLRDIRRTVETVLSRMGISEEVRGRVMSHGLSGVQVKHYDRHDYSTEKRNVLTAWERELDAIATGEKAAANVVPMARGAA